MRLANHFPVAKRCMPRLLADYGLHTHTHTTHTQILGGNSAFKIIPLLCREEVLITWLEKCRSGWDLITGQALCLLSNQIWQEMFLMPAVSGVWESVLFSCSHQVWKVDQVTPSVAPLSAKPQSFYYLRAGTPFFFTRQEVLKIYILLGNLIWSQIHSGCSPLSPLPPSC